MEEKIGSLSLFPRRQHGRSNSSNNACILPLCRKPASQTCLCNCGCDKYQAAPEVGCLLTHSVAVQNLLYQQRRNLPDEWIISKALYSEGHLRLLLFASLCYLDKPYFFKTGKRQPAPKENLFLYLGNLS